MENPVSVSLELELLLCARSNGQTRKLSEGEEEGKEYEKYEYDSYYEGEKRKYYFQTDNGHNLQGGSEDQWVSCLCKGLQS